MNDDGRPPTKAEKNLAWLACAGTVAGLAWATYAAYGRAVLEIGIGEEARTFVGSGCLFWLLLAGTVIGLAALGAAMYAVGRAVSWASWAMTNDVAGKPEAGDGLDDEEDWR